MGTIKEVDLLIVGQGIAGTCLALEARARGLKVFLVDAEPQFCASRVAPALIQPLVFKRLTSAWPHDMGFQTAIQFYTKFAAPHLKRLAALRRIPANSPSYLDDWARKSATGELAPYLGQVVETAAPGPHWGQLTETWHLDALPFLNSVRTMLEADDRFAQAEFSEADVADAGTVAGTAEPRAPEASPGTDSLPEAAPKNIAISSGSRVWRSRVTQPIAFKELVYCTGIQKRIVRPEGAIAADSGLVFYGVAGERLELDVEGLLEPEMWPKLPTGEAADILFADVSIALGAGWGGRASETSTAATTGAGTATGLGAAARAFYAAGESGAGAAAGAFYAAGEFGAGVSGKRSLLVGSSYRRELEPYKPNREEVFALAKRAMKVLQLSVPNDDELEKRILRTWWGIRPASRDRRPYLGRISGPNSALVMNGLGTRGFLAAPYLAKLLLDSVYYGAAIPVEYLASRTNAGKEK